MKWRALATDFDGTLASDGLVDEPTLAALKQLRAAGCLTILVTGRELRDFTGQEAFLAMFDEAVMENGASLFTPATGERQSLAAPPSADFVEALHQRGVTPISVGQSIVATVVPHETETLELIREMGLELQVIFNKGAVMILPSGVNKASGLAAALQRHGVDPAETVAVGDGENDHALLEFCGYGVAVANAVEALRANARFVTTHSAGAGVAELIARMLADQFE